MSMVRLCGCCLSFVRSLVSFGVVCRILFKTRKYNKDLFPFKFAFFFFLFVGFLLISTSVSACLRLRVLSTQLFSNKKCATNLRHQTFAQSQFACSFSRLLISNNNQSKHTNISRFTNKQTNKQTNNKRERILLKTKSA